MITSVVRKVQALLTERRDAGHGDLEAEIIFPVASEAVAIVDDAELGVVPGVSGGEGCSTAGGCATCPFMFDGKGELFLAFQNALSPFRERDNLRQYVSDTVEPIGGQVLLGLQFREVTDDQK